jgi:hypothetical protein
VHYLDVMMRNEDKNYVLQCVDCDHTLVVRANTIQINDCSLSWTKLDDDCSWVVMMRGWLGYIL